ncbi:PREDICTED: uncharacterized protein LOC105563077 [Vollenhovia emeryi]|uniref:uncharacterized protein LOC105563077 n=1 Tax=Vollenhovia emeryi TaxID=411798 RepID=UPI0005F3C94A|nr:PREDICTED: uncharacterized protein LOC105563077 [Vollenhovia emeryi]XP_011869767.1 PREDICTED: uncharacterized protein LOC105563077 [Vollenhovia emeryi]XP_011869768.1 PREDICTED: uncharacterized protein LOC105563077 [Vollenhovia emeryi]XP_011869769.1 PREDICTED: uncharacterized protein LOC105563077 [Vollenhovia emeryi]
MKSYVCTILLFLCVVVYSQYPDNPLGCEYEDKFYSLGKHTIYSNISEGTLTSQPCTELNCERFGRITLTSCPRVGCNPPMKLVYLYKKNAGIRRDKPYPDCCLKTVCLATTFNYSYFV